MGVTFSTSLTGPGFLVRLTGRTVVLALLVGSMLIVDVEMHVADVGAVRSEQGSHLRVFQGLVERNVDVVILSTCTVGMDAIRCLLVL